MKHLTDEERLAAIEGTAPAEAQAHLETCAHCAGELAAMKRSIRRLESMEWPARAARPSRILTPVFRWALAASVVLCIGFLAGRATGPNSEEIKTQIAQELRRELLSGRATHQAILNSLNELRSQQDANYVSLRTDLETLATTADARLRSTRAEIFELAGANSPLGENSIQ